MTTLLSSDGTSMSGNLIKRSALVVASAMLALLPLAGTASATTTSLEVKAMNVAKSEIGKPYVYGAAGPRSFDCSGLVYYSYAKEGKRINRVAQAQYNQSKKISWANRKPGDLVFFAYKGTHSVYHVGVYIGVINHHSVMVAAPSPGKKVRTEIIYSSYWEHAASIYFGRI